jgi:ABC-type transport system substrate-binding protein
MKKLLLTIVVLMLTSCIDVDDFGTTWDKTILDPALAGDWLRVPSSEHDAESNFPAGQVWHFTLKDGAYQVQTHLDGKEDDEPAYPVKTLALGRYLFLALGPKHGSIVRYEISDNDTFTAYGLDFVTAWEYIKKKYPFSDNIVRSNVKDAPVKIKRLDDTTAHILAELPDDTRFWSPQIILQRIEPKQNEGNKN